MVSRDPSWAGASVAGESHETLYNWVHQGHDLPGLSNVHFGYAAQGTNIQNAAHDLGTAFNALLPYWQGADADVAGASVSRFAGELFTLGEQITQQADTMSDVHGATVTVQQQITAPTKPSVAESMDGAAAGGAVGAIGGPAGMIAGAVTGGVVDYNNQVAAAKAAEEQARRDYQAFLAATGAAAATAPPLTLPGGISGLGEFAPPSAAAVGSPRNDVQQGSTGAAPAGTATQYAGPSGVGGSVAAAQLGGGAQTGTPPGSAPAATGTQFTPTAGPQGGGAAAPGAGTAGQGAGAGGSGLAPRPGGMPFGPAGAAGAPGGAVRPPQLRGGSATGGAGRAGGGFGAGRGAGGGGFGPAGSRGAGGSGGLGGSSRAAAGGGARSAGGPGDPGAEAAAARAAGPAGARGGMGQGMLPLGAAGRSVEDDQEHRRPDYLVEDPEVWGAGVYVAPPVIGEDPDVYQQR